MQGSSPFGRHIELVAGENFARIDENNVCWEPLFLRDQQNPDSSAAEWADYVDPESEIIRRTCDTDMADECERPLFWAQVDCESGELTDTALHHPHDEDSDPSYLPIYVVIPVQLASAAFKMSIAFIMETPIVGLFASLSIIDLVLDWFFLFTIGLVCRPCASLFIWIINLIYLPFWILAWVNHFFLDTMGLLVDGWMLLFNFSGCYLFIGRHCWITQGKSLWRYYDIPLLKKLIGEPKGFKDRFMELITPPDLSGDSTLLSHALAGTSALFSATPTFSQFGF